MTVKGFVKTLDWARIGKEIRAWRLAQGLAAREVYARLGMGQSDYSKL